MLNKRGSGRWLLSGATVEEWRSGPDLFKVGKTRLDGEMEFDIQNAWLIIDEGSYKGGIVALIVEGELHKTWNFRREGFEMDDIPRMVLFSALDTFHYLECRGRQHGCSCD